MFNIAIVGAGQLGSRHLQALKAIKQALRIQVVDPSESSLKVAKERYDSVSSEQDHKISYSTQFEPSNEIDIAIVATNSNVRRKALDSLFNASPIKNLVLEKLLFNNRKDYVEVGDKLAKTGAKAWVNCPMRVMPAYEEIRKNLANSPISYRVTGSKFGLVTNAIHYLDHAVHLCGCEDFELDTNGLDRNLIDSKRAGFLELNGTIAARFADGSRCDVTCYASGSAPVLVEIFNEKNRYLVKESEGKLWHSSENSQWAWLEQAAPIPFQSQITTGVVESLLSRGTCGLTPYATSERVHLSLLDPLLAFVRTGSPETTEYPFT